MFKMPAILVSFEELTAAYDKKVEDYNEKVEDYNKMREELDDAFGQLHIVKEERNKLKQQLTTAMLIVVVPVKNRR